MQQYIHTENRHSKTDSNHPATQPKGYYALVALRDTSLTYLATLSLSEVQRLLYLIYTQQLLPPWHTNANLVADPHIQQIRVTLEQRITQHAFERLGGKIKALNHPSFSDWLIDHSDDANFFEKHPIYSYLAKSATLRELREFMFQEMPLEMYFADILARLLPGLDMEMKTTVAENLWDELGHGQAQHAHQYLRLRMTRLLNIPDEAHHSLVDALMDESLELINFYFYTSFNRDKQTLLIGAMLATELQVPNCFEDIIAGYQRLGLPQAGLAYLQQHVHIDAQHAKDWQTKIVNPMLKQSTKATQGLIMGILWRLDIRQRFLDNLWQKLQTQQFTNFSDHISDLACVMDEVS